MMNGGGGERWQTFNDACLEGLHGSMKRQSNEELPRCRYILEISGRSEMRMNKVCPAMDVTGDEADLML